LAIILEIAYTLNLGSGLVVLTCDLLPSTLLFGSGLVVLTCDF